MNEQVAEMKEMGGRARKAAQVLATLYGAHGQQALESMPEKLLAVKESLLEANSRDVAAARQSGQPEPW
jgi:gamma-glutamyl phosphate reductase